MKHDDGEQPDQPVTRFDVVVEWTWGEVYRFQEESRFTVVSRDDIDPQVRAVMRRAVDRYAFDCGQLDRPLHPIILAVVVTPYVKRERLQGVWDTYQPIVNAMIEEKRAALEAKG